MCVCYVLGRDISNTALSSLPDQILGGLEDLSAESTPQLKELPPVQLFGKLQLAQLTYRSHCCAFQNVHRNGSASSDALMSLIDLSV